MRMSRLDSCYKRVYYAFLSLFYAFLFKADAIILLAHLCVFFAVIRLCVGMLRCYPSRFLCLSCTKLGYIANDIVFKRSKRICMRCYYVLKERITVALYICEAKCVSVNADL